MRTNDKLETGYTHLAEKNGASKVIIYQLFSLNFCTQSFGILSTTRNYFLRLPNVLKHLTLRTYKLSLTVLHNNFVKLGLIVAAALQHFHVISALYTRLHDNGIRFSI